jgi:hypothetical protein
MPMRITSIHHPRFGEYKQIIGDNLEEAGHQKLIGPEGTELGWIMPSEHASDEFIRKTKNKIVFELGGGSGERIIEPSLKNGAKLVFAADIYSAHLNRVNDLAQSLGKEKQIKTLLIDENWWHKALNAKPTVKTILDSNSDLLPKFGVDLMIARHVLQFGSPTSFLLFLDLAEELLNSTGELWIINMSPFLQYIFECDVGLDGERVQHGERLKQIVQQNRMFAEGKLPSPGGFISRLSTCIGFSDRPFLYFDNDTVQGLWVSWQQSRKTRGLQSRLSIKENYYFSPRLIWERNKLVGLKEFENSENHVCIFAKKPNA